MSVHVISWAYALPPLKPALEQLPSDIRVSPVTARAVLVKLADNANDDGDAFPSVARISKETELSERAVQNALRCLEEIGLVVSTPRPKRTTLYLVQVGSVPRVKGADAAPVGVVMGAADDTPGVQLLPNMGAADAPRTVSEPSGTRHSPAPPPRRARDPLWDLLDLRLGEVVTPSERGRRNRALSELRLAGVDEHELDRLLVAYRRQWPDLVVTPTAIAANLSTLRPAASAAQRARAAVCEDCGMGGGLHVSDCSKAPQQTPLASHTNDAGQAAAMLQRLSGRGAA